MKHIIKLSAVLLAVFLVSPLFSQTEEERQKYLERILCQTVVSGNEVRLTEILRSGQLPDNLECVCNEKGHTPMQFAVGNNDLFTVEVLVAAGAKIDSLSLIVAVDKDFLELVELFISRGTDLCVTFENSSRGVPASRYAQSDAMKEMLVAAEREGGVVMVDAELCQAK